MCAPVFSGAALCPEIAFDYCDSVLEVGYDPVEHRLLARVRVVKTWRVRTNTAEVKGYVCHSA